MMRRTTLISRVLILAVAAATVSLGGSHPKGDLVETAVAAGSFETLVAAVKAAGLVETLRGPGPYTVPRATLLSLLEPRNRATLTKILTYHVVPGRLAAADVVALNGAKTVEGGLVKFASNGRDVHVNNATGIKGERGDDERDYPCD